LGISPSKAKMPDFVAATLEDGVVVLTVSYGPGQLLKPETEGVLRQELVSGYNGIVSRHSESRDCIVVIAAPTADSSLVRGLFELWECVTGQHGRVVCTNYPDDYIDSILSQGLPELEGFWLTTTKDQAFQKLGK
jgi:hypothetical protein